MLVNETFDLCKNTTVYHKLLKRILINENFVQFRDSTVINYSYGKIIFESVNLNDANFTSITGFKNYEIDDFKNLFDSTTLKVIMGILFLIIVIFKTFEVLLFIDVGHP